MRKEFYPSLISVIWKKIEKKQRILRSSKHLTTKQLVAMLVAKIFQGNDEIEFDFKLTALVDIEMTRNIKYQVKINRNLIANNNF